MTTDPAANRFYASKRWRSIRRRKLARDPYCQCGPDCCPLGCHLPAEDVDHIDGNWRNNHPGNYASLTHACHARKTRRTTRRTTRQPGRQRDAEPHPGLLPPLGYPPDPGAA